MINMNNFRILLASRSPRRHQLLSEAGFSVRVDPINIEEKYPDSLPPYDVPVFLADLKADAARSKCREGEILLTADSIVLFGDKILGKPSDYADAVKTLKMLSGQRHEVITGVHLERDATSFNFRCISQVVFYPLSIDEIEYYVDRYRPFDKAGAYGIQDWIGSCKVKEIAGSYTNIVGLPVAEVYANLNKYF